MTETDRHRAAAAAVAADLTDDADAILLVGSTANGYADTYSDADLTVLGAVEPGERRVDGVRVEWTTTTRDTIEDELVGWSDDAALYSYATAEVLHDTVGIEGVLTEYDRYPPPVRREKLFAGWFHGSGNAFDARKAAERGDDRVRRCAATAAVEQFVALTYVLDRRFPPYRKWLFRDPPIELPGVEDAIAGDIEALDELEAAVRAEIDGLIADDRIERPYLFDPSYEALG
jgi:hypothetical protein